MLKNLWELKLKWQVVTVMCFLIVFMAGPLRPAQASDAPHTFKWKDYTFYTPVLSDPSVAYLYDLIGKESLVAGETTLVDWKGKIFLTAGGIFDISNDNGGELKNNSRNTFSGIPFAGLHVRLPLWKIFHVGGFYARDWERGKNIAGPKADVMLRF